METIDSNSDDRLPKEVSFVFGVLLVVFGRAVTGLFVLIVVLSRASWPMGILGITSGIALGGIASYAGVAVVLEQYGLRLSLPFPGTKAPKQIPQ